MEHFHLYTGNSLERLADQLLETLAGSPDGVFTPERFMVQSRGMELWLSQYIARRRGICANVSFEYPDMFLQSLYRSIPGLQAYNQEESGWTRGTLAWILMRVLPPLLADERFAIVRTYLQMDERGTIDEQKLFQLSVRLSDMFDQYMIFRPDRVRKWEESVADDGDDALWQAELWRVVADDPNGGRLHRARIQQELVRYLTSITEAPPSFPKRITIFGISYLPQYYVDVLLALSVHVEVNFFTINPSAEYWSDVATPHQQRTLSAARQQVYVGNILLASLGVEGRDFYEMLLERNLDPLEAGFEEPPCDTLLHCIQNDIYHYRDARTAEAETGHRTIRQDDRSVVVQNCHSRLREMEVLHDHLLSMFESDHTLDPTDVIVMAPAIEEYSPYIEAVFSTGGDQRIPFSIADRSMRSQYKITQALMALLHFHRARFEASAVIELLEFEHIARNFGITQPELETMKEWIRAAHIRWGLDKDDIAEKYELPVDEVNTWRHGLKRMLLGYAFPSDGETRMFEGIMPFDNIEGSETVTFAKLLAFFDALADADAMLRSRFTLEEWGRRIQELAQRFFSMTYDEKSILTPVFGELALLQSRSGYDAAVDIQNVIVVLNGCFTQEARAQRFLRGGITFCSLLPMRSIPARIICLIGMNNGEFPRRTQNLGFDEMVKHPRRGDRSKRNDDRYMFLEAILSAHDQLYLSYCGQNQRDNAVIPPSVTVSELLDYVENNFPEFDPRHTGDGVRVLTTKHKLQAFNPVYFKDGSGLFSYSKRYARAASAIARGASAPNPFSAGPLAPAPDADRLLSGVELGDFIRFFHNPAESFLRRRLQVTLRRREETIEDSELFALGTLDAYALKQKLLALQLDRGSIRTEYERVAASGVLPHGAAGRIAFDDLCADVESFAATIRAKMQGSALPDAVIDLDVQGVRITGVIGRVFADALLFYRMASLKPKDMLSAWITHCALQASCLPGYPDKTICCAFTQSKMETKEFTRVDDPLAVLGTLVSLYCDGDAQPLKFFPDASKRYADEIAKGSAVEYALDAARRVWEQSFTGTPSEGDNAYIRQAFMDVDPFDDEFRDTALRVYAPLNAQGDGKEGTGQ